MPKRMTVANIASNLGITPQKVIEYLHGIGVHDASYLTLLGKADIRELTDLVKPWGRIVAHVTEPATNAPPFVIEKRDEAIVLSREWNPQNKKVVWTKTYQPPVTAKAVTDDLSFLCEWESELLTRAARDGVKGCVRVLDNIFTNSPLHVGDTPANLRQSRKNVLRTYDAGPTLDVWKFMKPRVDGYAQAHPFGEQRNYLQLVRGILIALQDFHVKGFIHCDLHPGNIALPVRNTMTQASPEQGEFILVEPLWDEIRIIDLDFSASRKMVPPIRLPHQLTESGEPVSPMSDHLLLRLRSIDDWLKEKGQQNLWNNRAFWALGQNNNLLRCFLTLDWREDLWQLGHWLAYIRDEWGGGKHVIFMGEHPEVDNFITTFPELLKTWGGEDQIDWDSENLSSRVEAPKKLPHSDYIASIDNLLNLLRQQSDPPKHMVLLRRDHDPQYEAVLDKQRLVALEENARREMHANKEAERRAAERTRQESERKAQEALRTAEEARRKQEAWGKQQAALRKQEAQKQGQQILPNAATQREKSVLAAIRLLVVVAVLAGGLIFVRDTKEESASAAPAPAPASGAETAFQPSATQLPSGSETNPTAKEDVPVARVPAAPTLQERAAQKVSSGDGVRAAPQVASTSQGSTAERKASPGSVVRSPPALNNYNPYNDYPDARGSQEIIDIGGGNSGASDEYIGGGDRGASEQFKQGYAYYLAKDYRQAVALFRKSAEQANAKAQAMLGVLYGRGLGVAADHQQAASWYRKAAEQGDAHAQYNLGRMYNLGLGVAKDDRQAVVWFLKAAEQGTAQAELRLGNMYLLGHGVTADDQQAVAWYRRAAERRTIHPIRGGVVQEIVQAQCNLGLMYLQGRGVAADDRQAAAWFRKAAEQGHARAQYNLGTMYHQGRGVTADDQQAETWYRSAAAQGHTLAQNVLSSTLFKYSYEPGEAEGRDEYSYEPGEAEGRDAK